MQRQTENGTWDFCWDTKAHSTATTESACSACRTQGFYLLEALVAVCNQRLRWSHRHQWTQRKRTQQILATTRQNSIHYIFYLPDLLHWCQLQRKWESQQLKNGCSNTQCEVQSSATKMAPQISLSSDSCLTNKYSKYYKIHSLILLSYNIIHSTHA